MIQYDAHVGHQARQQWEASGGAIGALPEAWYAVKLSGLASVQGRFGPQLELSGVVQGPDGLVSRKWWMNLQSSDGPHPVTNRIMLELDRLTGGAGQGGVDEARIPGLAVDLRLKPKKTGKGERVDDVAPRGTHVKLPQSASSAGLPPGYQQGSPQAAAPAPTPASPVPVATPANEPGPSVAGMAGNPMTQGPAPNHPEEGEIPF